jgi:hypothetical protein
VSYIEIAKYNMMKISQRRGFHADTIRRPIDNMDAHHLSSSQLVVQETPGQDIAILDMKCFARGAI